MRETLDIFLDNVRKLLGDKSNYWLSKESGVTQGTLSRLMNKTINPTLDSIVRIAKALKVSPADLLTDNGEIKIPADILQNLENQSPATYEAIRGMLTALKREKFKSSVSSKRRSTRSVK